jgi:uncharacterized protein (DUF433 family)
MALSAGGSIMGKRLKWTPEKVARLAELRAAGMTRREIAETLGETEMAVQGAIEYYQIPRLRTRVDWTRSEERLLTKLVALRMPVRVIAAELRQAGYPPRTEKSIRVRIVKLRTAGQAGFIRRDVRRWLLATLPGTAADLARATGYIRKDIERTLYRERRAGLCEPVPVPAQSRFGCRTVNRWHLTAAGRQYLYGEDKAA